MLQASAFVDVRDEERAYLISPDPSGIALFEKSISRNTEEIINPSPQPTTLNFDKPMVAQVRWRPKFCLYPRLPESAYLLSESHENIRKGDFSL
jgi:hypothetical protein